MPFAEDLQKISEQERELQYTRFDADAAWLLGARLREMSVARAHVVVLDVRRFGQQLFFTALNGTTPDNMDWVRRKTNTVARFLRSSYAIGLSLEAKGSTITEKYGLPASDYVTHGGSFPITVVGAGVIGAVTVSGLNQRADHELVVEALCGELDKRFAELKLDPPA
jgi:uncharacterized protein (UPF0303 family)